MKNTIQFVLFDPPKIGNLMIPVCTNRYVDFVGMLILGETWGKATVDTPIFRDRRSLSPAINSNFLRFQKGRKEWISPGCPAST